MNSVYHSKRKEGSRSSVAFSKGAGNHCNQRRKQASFEKLLAVLSTGLAICISSKTEVSDLFSSPLLMDVKGIACDRQVGKRL